MSEYTCAKCRKIVKDIEKVICPYCNGRILFKNRTSKARELKA